MNEAFVHSRVPATPAGDTRGDAWFIERIIGGDQRALGELYDRHSRLLYSLIFRILRDRSESEEVLQEVFIQVWTRAETFRVASGSPVGWLVQIARNRAIDRLRANSVRFRAVESAPLALLADSPESRACLGEQQQAVARALDSLPRDQRVLIEQAYFLGLTQAELAKRHQLPLGTVKTRIRGAMLALRQQLSQSGIAP